MLDETDPLSLNVAKCEFMFLRNSKQLGKISEIGDLKVGEGEIKRVRKTKYLGLTIDETLSWNQQYRIVKGKLKGGSDSIRKLRQLLPQSQLFKYTGHLWKVTSDMVIFYGVTYLQLNSITCKSYRIGQ